MKVGFFHCKLQLCQGWWPQILKKCRYKFFEFVTRPRDQKVTWLGMWGLPMVSYHPAKFDGHRYCGRADIRLFICFSFKSMQNKDFNFQVYISLSIYLMTIWLNKNNYFVEYINNYFVEYINNSLNQNNYFVECINNYFFEYINDWLNI